MHIRYFQLIALLLGATLLVQQGSAQKKQYPSIDIPFKKYVLDNGLTLIVHEDHKVPIAAFNIWYHVGSKNEKPGKTGFAHLFEHIMFTSTEHWNNFDEVMQTVGGGNNNGTTNNDRTNYFETFTKTGLDRVLWLESDRMGYLLGGLDSAKIEVQRGVVQNEKRRWMNQPYAIAEELTVKSTYPTHHPYSWPVIGSMEDLSAASVEDVKEWFRTYYGPNNAVVTIAGNVQPDEVYEKVKKYFGEIPASPPISRHQVWVAKMSGTQYQTVQDRVPQARLQKTWNVAPWGTSDAAHLALLTDILTNGKSSRLYKRLVYDLQLASTVSAFTDEREIGSQFYIQADAKPGVELTRINEVIREELQKVFRQGVTDKEVERAKTNYFVNFIKGVERIGGFGGKSDILSQCQTFGKSPDYYKKIHTWIKATTPADIKETASQWLTDGEYVLQVLPYGDFAHTATALDRNIMPPVPPAPEAKFPEIKEFVLSNGLKVYLAERHAVPDVLVTATFNGGYAADPKEKPGLATLTGKMLTEGTATKTATQISDVLADLGAELRGYANLDHSYLSMRTLKTSFPQALALFAEVLLQPSFPQKDFYRVQKEQILAIKQEQANPEQVGLRILPALLFGNNHPYSSPLTGTGTEEGVQNITRADLIRFYKTRLAPNNGAFIVVGDISEDELRQQLEKSLSAWKAATVPAINIPTVATASAPSVYIVDKPGAASSVIYAAQISPSGKDKDYDAIQLMNNILGGTFLSRLNMNIREDKHWAYYAFSSLRKAKGPGMFMAMTPVQTDKTKEALAEVLNELTQIGSTKPIAEDEFKKEQTSAVLSVPGEWEVNTGLRNALLNMVEYDKGKAYLQHYITNLNKLTVPDIQGAAVRVINPKGLTWLIVGDRSKIEQGIKDLGLGTIKYIDPAGKEAGSATGQATLRHP